MSTHSLLLNLTCQSEECDRLHDFRVPLTEGARLDVFHQDCRDDGCFPSQVEASNIHSAEEQKSTISLRVAVPSSHLTYFVKGSKIELAYGRHVVLKCVVDRIS